MVACAVVAVALIGTNGAAATGKITDINRPSVRSRCTMGCRSWRPITQSSPTSGLRTGDRGLLCAERRELAAATTRIWAGEVAGKRARLNPHLPLRAPARRATILLPVLPRGSGPRSASMQVTLLSLYFLIFSCVLR
jgi:hypothetical protein